MISIEKLRNYKTTVIWGAGKKCSLGFWRGLIQVDYIVDSDQAKWGKELFGIHIDNPEVLLSEDTVTTVIIIGTIYEEEVRNQIKSMNCQADVYAMSEISPNILGGGCGVFYSQYGEDAIIQGIAKRLRLPVRHYMDIGANHPCYGNATMAFYLEGATGCLVEPNPDFIPIIERYRPNDTVIQCGVSSKENDGKQLLYYEIGGINTRNTFSSQIANEYRDRNYVINEKYITMVSLNRLMEQYGKKIDYISMDVEGLEYEILRDFAFDKYNVLIWNIEKSDDRIDVILLQNGYKLEAETYSNRIYLKDELDKL